MKKIFATLVFVSFITIMISCTQQLGMTVDDWHLSLDSQKKTLVVKKNDKSVFDFYSAYKLNNELINSKNYSNYTVKIKNHSSEFGKGKEFQITYTDDKLPTLIQSVFVFPGKDFLLTEITLNSKDTLSSNFMAPVIIENSLNIFENSAENRALFIPFDNDKWIRYKSHPLNFEKLTSYEVTAVFNNESRNGLVIGSVEHDKWKTGIELTADSISKNVTSLHCFGGIADETTRDIKHHGYLKGFNIKSPLVLLGFFDDWREGLDDYANSNAKVTPPRKWGKAMPFGWNSWGALQFKLRYHHAVEVSDFFKNNLQNNSFHNSENTVYIGLDSGWDRFSEEELKSFVNTCKANGQKAGIYWTPFTDWGKNPGRKFKADTTYRYKDIYLYANGQVQELDGAYALDPTHPAIETAMKYYSELFRKAGFEYVKMDFMTHGAMEADEWHNHQITTGIGGYNYGMKLLDKYFHDMYLALSISPIFPAQYAQSRRIACDAWNKIKDTEYTLNALSYGWWQDKIYSFNDPDHIVLRDATEGENRARYTSGVITGMILLGDDFSLEGDNDAKERAKKITTNSEINKLASGKSFIPLEGNEENSENIFLKKNDDGTLNVAIFNFDDVAKEIGINLERLGLEKGVDYKVKELWQNNEISLKGHSSILVPPKDVYLITFYK